MSRKSKAKKQTIMPGIYHGLPTLIKLLIGFAALIVILVCIFVGKIVYSAKADRVEEALIDKKFHKEIAELPDMKVTTFKLWEGDSRVVANIKDKGEVSFWYNETGTPSIESIDTYSTTYDCFYVDENRQKTKYAFTRSLILDKDSNMKQWFPFEVKTLKDLIAHYDDITGVLKTFPKNPARVPFEDISGKRQVLKKQNENFVIKESHNNKPVECDLYQEVL